MFLNKCEKIHQFLSSTKRDAHKIKLVPFFCLMVYMQSYYQSLITPTDNDALADAGFV